MELQRMELGPLGTNAYLLSSSQRGEAVVVDAPDGAAAVLERWSRENGIAISTVLMTHGHWDHLQDLAAVQRTGAQVWGHEADRRFFEEPQVMATYALPGINLEGVTVDRWLEHGEVVEVLGERMEVRHVPGHAPGNILFFFPASGWAFVGDALFAGGVGRYDLPGGSWTQLESSIRKQIFTLPDETIVYPGHGPKTTVGREKATNPFVGGAPGSA